MVNNCPSSTSTAIVTMTSHIWPGTGAETIAAPAAPAKSIAVFCDTIIERSVSVEASQRTQVIPPA